MKRIGSPANPGFKALRQLVESSRERRKAGLSVLDGIHLVAAYREHVGRPQRIAVSSQGMERAEIRALLERLKGVDAVVLDDALFRQLSSVVTPTGIVAVVKTPSAQPVPAEMDACVMLEDLQDPGNLGSILRTCAAAGVRHVLLSRGSVHAWSPRVLRAAMGAHFALAIYEGVNLQAVASAFTGKRVATRQRATQSVFETDLTGRLALLFGNEGAGLSPELLRTADIAASIPMPGKAESLNVAAAAAVCLFERVRQLAAKSVIRES
ncbi:MAG: RNA methyltransferase [Betaproteobacteria bacterium]|nr:RNA methyltransferase [Betaproteobacteria bacterium]